VSEPHHKLLARSQNALRGRWENFWACEQTYVVKLVEREAVIDKLIYTDICFPSACKPRHRSNVSNADVPAPPGADLAVPRN
jgi:hypothetical protein